MSEQLIKSWVDCLLRSAKDHDAIGWTEAAKCDRRLAWQLGLRLAFAVDVQP